MSERQKDKTSRQLQAEKTKLHLFNCALELLDTQGFETITVRDIVKRANVSVGCFYSYYTSKLDVYYETYALADEYFETTVFPAVEALSFEEAIYLYFDYYAAYSSEITGLALSKVLYNSRNTCFERKRETGMTRVLTHIIRQGLAEGCIISGDSAEQICHFLMIAVRGLMYNWCTHDGDYDVRKAMREYVSRLLMAFRA